MTGAGERIWRLSGRGEYLKNAYCVFEANRIISCTSIRSEKGNENISNTGNLWGGTPCVILPAGRTATNPSDSSEDACENRKPISNISITSGSDQVSQEDISKSSTRPSPADYLLRDRSMPRQSPASAANKASRHPDRLRPMGNRLSVQRRTTRSGRPPVSRPFCPPVRVINRTVLQGQDKQGRYLKLRYLPRLTLNGYPHRAAAAWRPTATPRGSVSDGSLPPPQ